MSDYSFMRSGFDNLIQAQPSLSSQEQANILGVLMIFTENAIREAVQYSEAASRPMLPKDFILALKRQAIPSGGFWQDPNLATRFVEHRDALLAEESSDEEEEEEGEEQDEGPLPEWTPAPSEASELCAKLNSAEREFEEWAPSNPMETIVRNAIVSAEDRFCG